LYRKHDSYETMMHERMMHEMHHAKCILEFVCTYCVIVSFR